MTKKIGFWAVLAIVMGSQIGSGVLMLPASLAPYGKMSLMGWLVSGLGAIALSLVFASLCHAYPKTGGPHVYVAQTFGRNWAFFSGWTYWVISWVSSTAVIVASIGYLSPILNAWIKPEYYLVLEALLLFMITVLNLKGVSSAGRAEFFLTLMKFIPLVLLPIAGLFYFDMANFTVSASAQTLTPTETLARVTLLTLWGFIGLESATTPAGSVENPQKTIPKAIVIGTVLVALLYFLNSMGIMGMLPGEALSNSNAPYVDATQAMFGGHWHIMISVMASIVCIGTLNAWMLASGQIALGLSQDKLLPAYFGKTNASGAPYVALLISAVGILPLLYLSSQQTLAQTITHIIDVSVVAFLFVYFICCLAFLKITRDQQSFIIIKLAKLTYGIIALVFCGWVIYQTDIKTLGLAGIFVLSGVPVFAYQYFSKTSGFRKQSKA